MVDLHCHSTCSDGLFSPIELLKKAEDEKLDYFSITDHDSVDAYKELRQLNINKYFTGKLIYGCEIRVYYNDYQMEVLAYGYDFDKLKDEYKLTKENYHKIKKALLNHLIENGKKVGFVYSNLDYNPSLKSERLFFQELLKHEENQEIIERYKIKHAGDFFRKMIDDKNSPLFFDAKKYMFSLEEAVNLIHACGGTAILAHPFGVYPIDNMKEVVEDLAINKKVDGFECMHFDITGEKSNYLVDVCKKYDLLCSGGSDFHGFEGQYFARANKGLDKIPTNLILKLLKRLEENKNSIVN